MLSKISPNFRPERQGASRPFLEHNTEREEIGGGIGSSAEPARRHVGQRCEGHSRAGELFWSSCSKPVQVSAGPMWSLCEAEIRILAWPRLVMKMLVGLVSRWMIPSECAQQGASVISMPKSSISLPQRFPEMRVLQGLPSRNSMAYERWPSCSPMS